MLFSKISFHFYLHWPEGTDWLSELNPLCLVCFVITFLTDISHEGLPCGSVVRNLSANSGDMGSIPVLGGSPGGVNGNSF